MSLVRNINFRYENFLLQVDKLEIPDRGITLIQGPSGSGKTTFLRILMGLEKTNFDWILNEENLAKLAPPDRRLGVVFQELGLFPHMSVKENILFHAQARKISKNIYLDKLNQYLQIAKLENKINQKISTLSGGEKQRVALLRAIIGEPRILLLDEPFSALDPDLKTNLKIFLKEIVKISSQPCLIVSHDEKDAEDLADFVIIFNNGKVSQTLGGTKNA